ncbi:MAG: PaeR7I family type II restriction endonuclease [Rhodoferax sp.]|uniref:PaeR7I family type II restriction endonuclease n=1 Tax=Rhodoferax sp. TaxID=50421 RepID=UPI0027329A3E|nr:PaeR7I family type II restriction endonuclease [Rhodoferax sp.]MDP2680435.1 PaeR7I family type II restriction endonuclease [Rhodoferax sp.]
MALDLCDFENQARVAIKAFWQTRTKATLKQKTSGKSDQGERAGVTGGKNMDGFANLVKDIVKSNGLPHAQIHQSRAVLTLPGYFRPTKLWDLLVVNNGRLVAALEFKSHVGPSFGNNFNNRTEEAIGTSHDLWTAYREGAFGNHARPFVGWLMVVEDAPGSRAPVKDKSPHFPVFKEFFGASYQKRYDILCQRLVLEQLYSTAAVIATPREATADGVYSELSAMTGLRSFVAALAGHIATEAASQT